MESSRESRHNKTALGLRQEAVRVAIVSRFSRPGTAAKLKAMATQTATFPATAAPASAGVLLPAFTLWWREIVRFYRQRARVVGVIALPALVLDRHRLRLRNLISLRTGRRPAELSKLFLSRHAGDDRALHRNFHHDVGDRRPQRRFPAFGAGSAGAARRHCPRESIRRHHSRHRSGIDFSGLRAACRRTHDARPPSDSSSSPCSWCRLP